MVAGALARATLNFSLYPIRRWRNWKRVLNFGKLKLSPEYQFELLGDYLTYRETIDVTNACPSSVPGCNRPAVS